MAREADAAIDAQGAKRWGRNAIGRESGHAIRRPNGECFFKHTRHSVVLKVCIGGRCARKFGTISMSPVWQRARHGRDRNLHDAACAGVRHAMWRRTQCARTCVAMRISGWRCARKFGTISMSPVWQRARHGRDRNLRDAACAGVRHATWRRTQCARTCVAMRISGLAHEAASVDRDDRRWRGYAVTSTCVLPVRVLRTRDANRRSARSCMRTGRAGRRRCTAAPRTAHRARPRIARCAQA